jgi:hypothetical protein
MIRSRAKTGRRFQAKVRLYQPGVSGEPAHQSLATLTDAATARSSWRSV